MFQNNSKTLPKDNISAILALLSYPETINMLITYHLANDAKMTRGEAYELAIVEYSENSIIRAALSNIIDFGTTDR